MASPPNPPSHRQRSPGRLLSRLALTTVAGMLSFVACDGTNDLRELDRGTDSRPGIKATPPEEGQ